MDGADAATGRWAVSVRRGYYSWSIPFDVLMGRADDGSGAPVQARGGGCGARGHRGRLPGRGRRRGEPGSERRVRGVAAIKTDLGVTADPCPEAFNKAHGCIYLGTLSDLTEGPFAAVGKVITDTQKAFWARVNQDGGIGDYDVDVTTYVRDSKYNPQVHNQLYQEIKTKVLGLAQTFGSPTSAAIIGQLEAESVVSAPVGFTSHLALGTSLPRQASAPASSR